MDIATHDTRRDAARRQEREREMPGRMLGIAREALLAGWMVVIDARNDGVGWRLVIRDDRHCMHLAFIPTKPGRLDRHGHWSHTRQGLWGTCVAAPQRVDVRMSQISEWLTSHPDQCEGDEHADALARYHTCHCSTADEEGHAHQSEA